MRLEYYYKLIEEAEDIKIDTSTPSKLQKTLIELKRRKRILKKLKKMIIEDIRNIEVDYLLKRIAIRKEIEDYKANPSIFKKLRGRDSYNLRLKTLKKIGRKREAKIKPYNELREHIDKLLEEIDKIIVENDPKAKREYIKEEFNPPEFR